MDQRHVQILSDASAYLFNSGKLIGMPADDMTPYNPKHVPAPLLDVAYESLDVAGFYDTDDMPVNTVIIFETVITHNRHLIKPVWISR